MKNLKFNLPIWLLVLGLAFGLFSCENVDKEGEPCYDDITPLTFTMTDMLGNSLSSTKEDSFYDLDYVHVIMHDGKRVDDLKYEYNPFKSYHPSNEGYAFLSNFLGDIAYSNINKCNGDEKQNPNSIKYTNQPFYLVLSPDDTDTLLWDGTKLYHNGNPAPKDSSPFMIRKKGN
ncbi:hypothetical protein ACE193_03300 [Bernardetia sp. OM2101]|uniref:hypothetical protein n=1 Tax=Bernardetia sp. OM2101 TaxID=3344876 RepID=UPI0035D1210E